MTRWQMEMIREIHLLARSLTPMYEGCWSSINAFSGL